MEKCDFCNDEESRTRLASRLMMQGSGLLNDAPCVGLILMSAATMLNAGDCDRLGILAAGAHKLLGEHVQAQEAEARAEAEADREKADLVEAAKQILLGLNISGDRSGD